MGLQAMMAKNRRMTGELGTPPGGAPQAAAALLLRNNPELPPGPPGRT
jgi:hypothetical protein